MSNYFQALLEIVADNFVDPSASMSFAEPLSCREKRLCMVHALPLHQVDGTYEDSEWDADCLAVSSTKISKTFVIMLISTRLCGDRQSRNLLQRRAHDTISSCPARCVLSEHHIGLYASACRFFELKLQKSKK